MIPVQPDAMNMSFNSTHQLRNWPVTLIVNRDNHKMAVGSIFLDYGNSL